MSVTVSPTPYLVFMNPNNSGSPASGFKLFTYQAGTTTKQNSWTDSTQTTLNANPIVLDSNGAANVWLDPTLLYKFILANPTDTDPPTSPLRTVDNLEGPLTNRTLAAFITPALIGADLYPQSAAELASGITPTFFQYPVGNVLRYGIVANQVSAATTNTAALQALLTPQTTGITGNVIFPNLTGSDIYYLNDLIPMRNGIYIDGQGSTLNWTRTGSSQDTDSGFLHWLSGCKVENITLTINYTYGGGTGVGEAIFIGARGLDSARFSTGVYASGVYDSLLSFIMGMSIIRNVVINITTNTSLGNNQYAIGTLGGTQNVLVENVQINGNNSLPAGIYGEFGWATNEAELSARQTSHPNNWSFRNVRISSVVGTGLSMNGAYAISHEGIYFNTCGAGISYGPGEARYYRPWSTKDLAGAKHFIEVRKVVAYALTTGAAVAISGSNNPPVSGGYLSKAWAPSTSYTVLGTVRANGVNLYVLTVAGTSAGSGGPTGTGTGIIDGGCTWNYVPLSASSDLLDTIVEDVTVLGSSAVPGIQAVSPTRLIVRHAFINGCNKGIIVDQDCTHYDISDAHILNSVSFGIQVGLTDSVYSPARQSNGTITDCFIAGGQAAAIFVATSIACTIENCRFGFETIHDGVAETTQLQAVTTAADANGIIVRNCYVGGIAASTACFNLAASGNSSRGCRLQSIAFNGSVSTSFYFSGLWLTDFQSPSAQALANGNTISNVGYKTIRTTNSGAVTGILMPTGSWPDQQVTIFNENASNSVTFDIQANSKVADGVSSVIAALTSKTFVWNAGTALWYRVG